MSFKTRKYTRHHSLYFTLKNYTRVFRKDWRVIEANSV